MTPPLRPQLSVIVACHGRSELLKRCLESLSRQTQDPATFEVIVAAGDCDDGIAETIKAFEATFRLLLVQFGSGGRSAALDAAIGKASGAAYVLLDDDTVAPPDLLATHAEETRPEIGPVIEDFDHALRLWLSGRRPLYLRRPPVVQGERRSNRLVHLDARRQGVSHLDLSRRCPDLADELLDWLGTAADRELTMRRVCLALHLPATPLAHLSRLIPGESRKAAWLRFTWQLAFWSGVRACTDRREWALATQEPAEIPVFTTVICLSSTLCEAVM
jgi:glycosyltransferase involved in cell wall biosynthesis